MKTPSNSLDFFIEVGTARLYRGWCGGEDNTQCLCPGLVITPTSPRIVGRVPDNPWTLSTNVGVCDHVLRGWEGLSTGLVDLDSWGGKSL